MWRISTVLYLIISIIVTGLVIWTVINFRYLPIKFAQSFNSVKSSLTPGERKIRDVAGEIEKYPNASLWEIKNNPANPALEYPPNTEILFYTNDDPEIVVSYFKARLQEKGWTMKDEGKLCGTQGCSKEKWVVYRRDRMSFLLDSSYYHKDYQKDPSFKTNYRIKIENLDLYKHLPANF